GDGSNAHFNAIIELPDQSIIAVGDSNGISGLSANNYSNVFAVCLSSSGSILWQKAYGLTNKETHSSGTAIQILNDGTLEILALYTNRFNDYDRGYPTYLALHINDQGTLLSADHISDDLVDATSDAGSGSLEILPTRDGGYFITGSYFIDNYTWTTVGTKIDANGTREWGHAVLPENTRGELTGISGTKTLEVADGILILSSSYLNPDVGKSSLFLYKVDDEGNYLWGKIISDVTLDNQINAGDLHLTASPSGNAIVSLTNGYSTRDFSVFEVSAQSGEILWAKSYGPQYMFDRGYGGNTPFTLIADSKSMIFGAGANFITRLSSTGSTLFESEDFTYEDRTNYKAIDANYTLFDKGFWHRFDISTNVGSQTVSLEATATGIKETKAFVGGGSIRLLIDNPLMWVNGEQQDVDPGSGTSPVIRNGRTIVPIRAIVEALGGTIAWESTTKTITISAQGNIVVMQIGSLSYSVNGSSYQMETAPVIINSRTMIPLRAATESLHCDLEWDPNLRQITISY
ncbi:MAG: copper amine oxidase N-terminal domain-containing protein, partial [Vallitaleaceae bacterium]|nr:copper amine oxidase N-terminal domain-containing protein [Vallitaleaceae bacterium]